MVDRRTLGLALVVALTGCGGVDHATLEGTTSMPDDSQLTGHGGAIHTGIATAFTPRVWTHDLWGTHEQSSGIDVQTSDPSILRVAHVTHDKRFVVWGAGQGDATLTVTLDGQTAMSVPLQVLAPSP